MSIKLALSTLGCPDMSLDEIAALALENGVSGIELMGGEYGLISPELSHERKLEVKNIIDQNGLVIPDITTYAMFVSPDKKVRRENSELLARYCELAALVGAPYVRSFIGTPESGNEDDVCLYAAEALSEAAELSAGTGAYIIIETHDWIAMDSKRLVKILGNCPDSIGVLWDFEIPESFGEPLPYTFSLFDKKIRHVHVKDMLAGAEKSVHCAVGEGGLPIAEAVNLLKSIGFDGFCSYEWERMWIRDLAPIQEMLPKFANYMRTLM